MECLFAKNDRQMFDRYLNNSNVFFEFGSGGSTFLANSKQNIQKIYSVESDSEWHQQVRKKIEDSNKTDKITYLYCDMNTEPNSLGHPGKDCTAQQKINYSNQINLLSSDKQKEIDLVLIDGRFRIACCLKCLKLENSYIIFDDFLNRKQYHCVLDYYDIIDKTKDERMVILKKKENIVYPKDLISIHEKYSPC